MPFQQFTIIVNPLTSVKRVDRERYRQTNQIHTQFSTVLESGNKIVIKL